MTWLSWLEGKKTYLAAIAVAVISLLAGGGILSSETAAWLSSLLGAGGLAALRAGVNRNSEPSSPDTIPFKK